MIILGSGDGITRNIYSFGDSITDGSTFIPDPVNKYGYIYALEARLGWTVYNYAVGGTRIEDSTQTANMSSIKAKRKDRIVWLTGYNDMRFYGNDSGAISTYGGRLSSWLTVLSGYGCPILLGNCLKMTASGYTQGGPDFDNGSDAAANAYSAEISTIASGFPLVTVVDVNANLSPTAGLYQGDLVHFNRTGCNTLADIFISRINSVGLR